jgi:hypothetical protein
LAFTWRRRPPVVWDGVHMMTVGRGWHAGAVGRKVHLWMADLVLPLRRSAGCGQHPPASAASAALLRGAGLSEFFGVSHSVRLKRCGVAVDSCHLA